MADDVLEKLKKFRFRKEKTVSAIVCECTDHFYSRIKMGESKKEGRKKGGF